MALIVLWGLIGVAMVVLCRDLAARYRDRVMPSPAWMIALTGLVFSGTSVAAIVAIIRGGHGGWLLDSAIPSTVIVLVLFGMAWLISLPTRRRRQRRDRR